MKLYFIELGKPMQNGYIESFNGKFRENCLNGNSFGNLKEARSEIERWGQEYNGFRPHISFNNLTPMEFFKKRQKK